MFSSVSCSSSHSFPRHLQHDVSSSLTFCLPQHDISVCLPHVSTPSSLRFKFLEDILNPHFSIPCTSSTQALSYCQLFSTLHRRHSATFRTTWPLRFHFNNDTILTAVRLRLNQIILKYPCCTAQKSLSLSLSLSLSRV